MKRRIPTTRRMEPGTVITKLVTMRGIGPKKKESSMTNFTGGDLHYLTHTDDQPKGIMMLAQVGPMVERLNNIELLVDSVAVCHVRSC